MGALSFLFSSISMGQKRCSYWKWHFQTKLKGFEKSFVSKQPSTTYALLRLYLVLLEASEKDLTVTGYKFIYECGSLILLPFTAKLPISISPFSCIQNESIGTPKLQKRGPKTSDCWISARRLCEHFTPITCGLFDLTEQVCQGTWKLNMISVLQRSHYKYLLLHANFLSLSICLPLIALFCTCIERLGGLSSHSSCVVGKKGKNLLFSTSCVNRLLWASVAARCSQRRILRKLCEFQRFPAIERHLWV